MIMTLHWTGPLLALITVVTIGVGHILVRRLNYHFGIWPAAPLFVIGTGILAASLFTASDVLSAALGIVGLTTVIDGNEILRQEKRIAKGHAPRNPRRPVGGTP